MDDAVDRKRSTHEAGHVFFAKDHRLAAAFVLALTKGHEALANAGRHRVLMDTEHDDPVVGEDVCVHRLLEGHVVEFWAVDVDVIHVDCLDALGLEPVAGGLPVDSRGCCHVEALAALQPVFVVNSLKAAILRDAGGLAVHASSAVSLVHDRQVEGGRTMVELGGGDLLQRLVGAEDHPREFGFAAEHARDLCGVRSHRALQLVDADVLVLAPAASGSIRADDSASELPGRVPQPFASGLRHQGDAGG